MFPFFRASHWGYPIPPRSGDIRRCSGSSAPMAWTSWTATSAAARRRWRPARPSRSPKWGPRKNGRCQAFVCFLFLFLRYLQHGGFFLALLATCRAPGPSNYLKQSGFLTQTHAAMSHFEGWFEGPVQVPSFVGWLGKPLCKHILLFSPFLVGGVL